MTDTDLPWIFTEPLERESLDYMIVGAFATMAFGVARTTEDLDLVLGIAVTDIARFERAFPKKEYYRPPRESLVTELSRPERGHFNVIHNATLSRADCYLVGQDKLQVWALQNRRKISLENRQCFVAPPEIVILKKLEYFREGGHQKHIHDISAMIQIAEIDLPFIEAQVERLGLREQWLVCQPPDA